MKIGVWIDNDIDENAGGGFSYISKLIKVIDQYTFHKDIEIVFLSTTKVHGLTKPVLVLSLLPQILYKLIRINYVKHIFRSINIRLLRMGCGVRRLSSNNIKIVYYLHQEQAVFPNFPFIASNWDIGHRSTYSFPELVCGNNFTHREHFYNNILPKALMVFCESEAGKKEIVKYTHVNEKRIRVIPLFASNVVSIRVDDNFTNKTLEKYNITKEKYLFYPAQFWAHKNHYNLIQACMEVLNKYTNYKLILCGSDKGNKEYYCRMIKEMGLDKYIHVLNFLSNEELYVLYKNAAALVMASHFGPTNMPPIEAMEIGCPVVCSDLEGHREILGDAAVYFDPLDVNSMVKAFCTIIEDNETYRSKIKSRLESNIFNSDEALFRMNSYLLEAVNIRNCWQ